MTITAERMYDCIVFPEQFQKNSTEKWREKQERVLPCALSITAECSQYPRTRETWSNPENTILMNLNGHRFNERGGDSLDSALQETLRITARGPQGMLKALSTILWWMGL